MALEARCCDGRPRPRGLLRRPALHWCRRRVGSRDGPCGHRAVRGAERPSRGPGPGGMASPVDEARGARNGRRMTERYDLLVLGSGSTAFAAALKAAELGKTALMTERRTVGGTCVNRGCLPSKNLIEAARIHWEAQHPRFPGLGGKKLDLDFRALVAGKDEVIHDYRAKKYESILSDSDRISIVQGRAAFVDPHTIQVDGRTLRGDQVVIATGSRPAVPAIPGLDQVPYLTSDLLTSDEPMALRERPRSPIVVGGAFVRLELAPLFHPFGPSVTLLQPPDRILPEYAPAAS